MVASTFTLIWAMVQTIRTRLLLVQGVVACHFVVLFFQTLEIVNITQRQMILLRGLRDL